MDDAFLPLISNPKVFSIVAQLLSPWLSLLTSHLDLPRALIRPARPIPNACPAGTVTTICPCAIWGTQHIPRHSLKVAYYLTDLERAQLRRHYDGSAQQSTQRADRYPRRVKLIPLARSSRC